MLLMIIDDYLMIINDDLMIINDYLMIIDDYLMIINDYLMVIKKNCNKTNCSSVYKEVIRPVLNFFFFFTIKFHKH